MHVKAARHAAEDEPLDRACRCAVCTRHSRAYLRHLFNVAEPTASRLVSLHNIAWTLALLDRARQAIAAHRFDAFRRDVLSVWG